jgi:hypothetical protein
MKFDLIFVDSGDCLPFECVYNTDLLRYFVDVCNERTSNHFSDCGRISKNVSTLLNDLHNAVTLTNTTLGSLGIKSFPECNDRRDYLAQSFLNRQHEQWVNSQRLQIDIEQLRHHQQPHIGGTGWRIHDLVPDDIQQLPLAEIMAKMGMIWPYEEVNMTVHRLESFFSNNMEFQSQQKWNVFDNPFFENFVSNNDRVNFSFAYTYVGRQYYDKWKNFDTELACLDHYNYETLEFAFQINLARPETIAYSPEFLSWCADNQVRPITTQIPIGNVIDLEKNLTHYRQMLYNNSAADNRASLHIH